jgi:large subunit ribosomal protein L9
MEVILRQDVSKVGHRGDLVKVADGFARNFLLPRKLAVAASDGNRKMIEQEKGAAVRREATERGDAEKLSQMLTGVTVSVSRKAGEGDQLFGSVTGMDVADALAAKGFQIDRRKIQLDEPLKHLGEFDVPVKLHKDVTAQVKVQVVKEAESV